MLFLVRYHDQKINEQCRCTKSAKCVLASSWDELLTHTLDLIWFSIKMLPSFFLNTALFFGQKINKKCASENLSWTPCISEEQIYCQTQTDHPPPPYADSTQINCFIHRIDLALTLRFSVRRFISVVQQTSPLNRCNVRSILRQKLLIAYCFFFTSYGARHKEYMEQRGHKGITHRPNSPASVSGFHNFNTLCMLSRASFVCISLKRIWYWYKAIDTKASVSPVASC